jgi:MoaA/NifB/PqqE/SkfB family radical SAM enzyme
MDSVKRKKLLRYALRYNTPRKTANFLLATYEGRTRKVRVRSYPFRAQFEPASMCNLRCPGCYTGMRHHEKRKSGLMPYEDFVRYLEPVAPYVFSVALYNWGEAFLNPDLPRMVAYAGKRGVGTVVHSNLNILDAQKAEAIVRAGLLHLYLSIDGATQETYEKYRRGGDYERVLANLRLLVAAKRRLGSEVPFITWKVLTFPHVSQDEIRQAYRTAMEIGCDGFLTADPTIGGGGAEKAYDQVIYDAKSGQTYSVAQRLCRYLYGELYVDWDGAVLPCCIAFRDKEVFGNLNDGDFRAVWNGPSFLAARRLFAEPRSAIPPDLIPCGTCQVVKNFQDRANPADR